MARNTNQVFGKNLDAPVDFVLFYAEETDNPLRPKGGTGQAVEMARRKGIPTIKGKWSMLKGGHEEAWKNYNKKGPNNGKFINNKGKAIKLVPLQKH